MYGKKYPLGKCTAFSIFLLLLTAPAITTARTIYVDDDNPADFNNIQAAINNTNNGDTIIVADGTYYENINFKGKNIVLRSTNPNDPNIVATTIIDGFQSGSVVTFENCEDANCVLNGFTITNGNASNGGGIYCRGGSPTITNCNFNRNWAVNGAGIYNQESNPTITNCSFNENEARCGNWGFGGGVYNYQSNPIIERCIMTNNYAEWGGGIACNENSSPTIKNCMISGNLTYQDGGGIYCGSSSNPVITNSKIVSNESEEAGGAGIACFGGSAPVITNCTVAGNGTGGPGGGIYCGDNSNPMINNCLFVGNCYGAVWCSNSSPSLENCTIAYNSAGICNGGSPTVRNCIVWGSVTLYGEPKPWIIFSDVQGGWPDQGNIDADPCFANAANGDYHLKSQAGRWDANEGRWTKDDMTSLCIDAGDPNSPIGLEPFPNGGIINMGAYGGTREASKSYFGEPVCETIVAGDINGDCRVDFKDFALLAFHWLEEH